MDKELLFFQNEKKHDIGTMLGDICRIVNILLDLEIEDEKIKLILIRYFDIRYSQATNIVEEEKDFRNL